MILTELTKENCEIVRQWRNQDISAYRTPYFLTREQQEDFYLTDICNRNSYNRWWAIKENLDFIGMTGLTNISLENRNAEISIVINPNSRQKGLGETALKLLLDKGFNELNLENIYGECYWCNNAVKFWNKMILKYNATEATLPARKYWNGAYYSSLYFTFNKNKWRA